MKKVTKETGKEIIAKLQKVIGAIFDASADAKTLKYKSGTSTEYKEEPGEYNGCMTRAMAHDMMSLALFISNSDEPAYEKLKAAAEAVREKDIQLRRIFDDMKDKRPLSEYPIETTEEILSTFKYVRDLKTINNPLVSLYTKNIPVWIEKILKTDVWAYCLEHHHKLDEAIYKADYRCFNENGDQVHGVNEKDAECIRLLVSMKRLLLKALIKIPFNNEQSQICMDKIEILQTFIDAIANEDKEMLEQLGSCAELDNA